MEPSVFVLELSAKLDMDTARSYLRPTRDQPPRELRSIWHQHIIIIKLYSIEPTKMDIDYLNVDPEREEEMHKMKRLIPRPNSYFMDVKCPVCKTVSIIFSHAQSVIYCPK